MFKAIVKRTLRVPLTHNIAGNGSAIARQLDVALMQVGFKLSQELLSHLSGLHPMAVKNIANDLIPVVRELVGGHVRHNTYFRDFPNNIPDTIEFWMDCISNALKNIHSREAVMLTLSYGYVNLYDLPKYGRYLHSYEDMVAVHEAFITSVKDRMTVLHLGNSLEEEVLQLYYSLAGSVVPLNESDRALLIELAEVCLDALQPPTFPVRENRALVNKVRALSGKEVLVDTLTDVLRLACVLSDGDVTLQQPTKFKSFSRLVRRILLTALESVVADNPAKLADVNQYREVWKRLGERLHPYETSLENAQAVFEVARKDRIVRSWAAKVELAFEGGDIEEAIRLLAGAPGMLFRSLDRILQLANDQELESLLVAVQTAIPKVSGRVILSVAEHLINRMKPGTSRLFANSKGRAWVTKDIRSPLAQELVLQLLGVFVQELKARFPVFSRLVVNPDVYNVALPLSDKNKAEGFGVMPKGSIFPVNKEILRFFAYWKQKHYDTDWDLACGFLVRSSDGTLVPSGQVSWTNLRDEERMAFYSGDLRTAPNGASEFIDVRLSELQGQIIVPILNYFGGERFGTVEEAFFGFMTRELHQMGLPFEARTVLAKSGIEDKGGVALPVIFYQDDEGQWYGKWVHLYVRGQEAHNRYELSADMITQLVRTILEKEFLRFKHLIELLEEKSDMVIKYKEGMELGDEPIVYIGLHAPQGLPEGSVVYTLSNLHELIPA